MATVCFRLSGFFAQLWMASTLRCSAKLFLRCKWFDWSGDEFTLDQLKWRNDTFMAFCDEGIDCNQRLTADLLFELSCLREGYVCFDSFKNFLSTAAINLLISDVASKWLLRTHDLFAIHLVRFHWAALLCCYVVIVLYRDNSNNNNIGSRAAIVNSDRDRKYSTGAYSIYCYQSLRNTSVTAICLQLIENLYVVDLLLELQVRLQICYILYHPLVCLKIPSTNWIRLSNPAYRVAKSARKLFVWEEVVFVAICTPKVTDKLKNESRTYF